MLHHNIEKAEAHCASADFYFCANWGFIAQAKAAELKMENDCVRFAHDFKLFPQEIPQFSIFNCQFFIMQQLYKLKFAFRYWVCYDK